MFGKLEQTCFLLCHMTKITTRTFLVSFEKFSRWYSIGVRKYKNWEKMKKTAEASKIGSGKIQLKLVKFFKTLSIAQFLSKMLQIFSTFLSLLIVNTARIKDNSKNFYINKKFSFLYPTPFWQIFKLCRFKLYFNKIFIFIK